MLEYRTGNLFDSNAQALVNPVNLVGAMGKGLALEFKARFPGLLESYRADLASSRLAVGLVSRYLTGLELPHTLYLFPTKRHWKDKSRLEDIVSGLFSLAERIRTDAITSVAVPALGCGLGGLEWNAVKPLLEQHLAPLDCLAIVYPPNLKD